MAKSKKKTEEGPRDVVDIINEKLGAHTIAALGDVPMQSYRTISTGSIGLDRALGVGGLPLGRIVEVYGPESSGKTTLTLHAIADAQAQGYRCAFVDAEHALDVAYASNLGVDTDALLVSQPDNGEQALDIVAALTESGQIDVIVIDSVAALTPKAEIEGDMGAYHVGVQARLMSQALRKLVAVANRTDTLIIFINQMRMKIGVRFGSPETTTGGNALKFYASVRLDVRRIGQVKQGEDRVGNRTRVKVVKNKLASPFREAEFDIEFGSGISQIGELIEYGVAEGVLTKAGAWINYGDLKLGNGLANVKAYLAENLEIASTLRDALTTGAGET